MNHGPESLGIDARCRPVHPELECTLEVAIVILSKSIDDIVDRALYRSPTDDADITFYSI